MVASTSKRWQFFSTDEKQRRTPNARSCFHEKRDRAGWEKSRAFIDHKRINFTSMFARIFIPISRSFRSFCLKGRCTQCFKTGVVFHGITVVLSYFYGAWWSWTTHKTTESEALSLSFSFLPLFASCDSSSRKMHLSTVFTPFLLHKPTRARTSKHAEGMNDRPGNSCKLPRDIHFPTEPIILPVILKSDEYVVCRAGKLAKTKTQAWK